MHARAALATVYLSAPGRPGRSRLTTLRSQAPLVLRPTTITQCEPWVGTRSDVARVSLAAGAAGPVGGDHLSLHVSVGPGSTLVLSEISASLLLPGVHGEQSCTRTQIHVAAGGTFVWLPQPMIAAAGCHHLNDVRVELEEGARLLVREEVLLGRHGEAPGDLAQHVQVRLAGQPLYRQDLDFGPHAPGWDSPAVTGAHQALGSILIVDPGWVDGTPPAQVLDDDAAVLPLAGPAVLISAVSVDSMALRRALTAGLHALGTPWMPPA